MTLVLWGSSDSFIDPMRPVSRSEADSAYAAKAAAHGVTRLIPSGRPSESLVEAAQAHGLEVHPYVAFNFHGGLVLYQWSLDYMTPEPLTPEARAVADAHRPVWRTPSPVAVSDYAKKHPEQWSLGRDRSRKAPPGWRVTMSLAYPEVRKHLVGQYLEMMEAKGARGVQVEFVDGNVDAAGVADTGYEDRMMAEFEQHTGRRALEIPNDDPEWLAFRVSYVTQFMRELRDAVKARDADAPVTATMLARERGSYVKVLLDWEAWVTEGLLDEMYVWFRSTSDLDEVEKLTREAVQTAAGHVPVVAELSCYHPSSIQQPAPAGRGRPPRPGRRGIRGRRLRQRRRGAVRPLGRHTAHVPPALSLDYLDQLVSIGRSVSIWTPGKLASACSGGPLRRLAAMRTRS